MLLNTICVCSTSIMLIGFFLEFTSSAYFADSLAATGDQKNLFKCNKLFVNKSLVIITRLPYCPKPKVFNICL